MKMERVMGDYLTPEQVATELGVLPKTVRGWLRNGEMIGIKIGKSWRVHPDDLRRIIDEQFFNARFERARRVHSDIDWCRGQCRECGKLMPEPRSNQHWVCSNECLNLYDGKCSTLLGRGSEEFVMACGSVVPPY